MMLLYVKSWSSLDEDGAQQDNGTQQDDATQENSLAQEDNDDKEKEDNSVSIGDINDIIGDIPILA